MSTRLAVQVVARARMLIAKPSQWTTLADARDRAGQQLPMALDARAVSFCAWGALQRASFDLIGNETAADALALDVTRRVVGLPDIEKAQGKLINTNDKKGHGAVLAIFDRFLQEAYASLNRGDDEYQPLAANMKDGPISA